MELTFNKLTRKFNDKIAVNEISTKISTGVYGLLGANGAGKTTLMRMICGVINPTSGDILLDNNNIHDLGEEYRNLLGYLPQDFGYYPDFTAQEFMYYIAALKGISTKRAKVKTKELLEMVALSKVANKKIGTFSGGMKQRLGIAQAVLNDPKILILDEPTAGLDPKERVRFRNLVANFAKNKIVILSTHIVSDIEYIADKIFIMKEGNFIMQGTVDELIALAKGYVWECVVDSREVEKYESKYCIGNLHHLNGKVKLRIISKEKPMEDALPEIPTLEDLYLYYFQDERSYEEM
ncbi:ABC transporter ATP-binding protein [Clostridium botulinum]|uniref:ABC transporter ATP-binding protein n=1 Tax=Clostridium botulinum TaxID=1491 RepID=UPI00052D753B|nr:ABC transporter ATP-binding protein [Clostridium botulinum]KGM95722.1 ABC transporter ATP-binding protein [Clostridium botulinum D str. CCUG 7971]KOC48031.1 ABC transporter ATP-binding protein [Clostridium botulinum]MCD3350859.1 ABC transporter ATP-binding protein [Clostridium botulinum D/C]MCD3359880.1 ABC transporter ATP-binding protein [Clostridium botulinum D/C]MCD3361791.1 ABC transporter ATP-binding protein [Clostridium botulinum D/C]